MTPSNLYVADHINRISGVHAGHLDRILDSKWRIASHLGLFPVLDPYDEDPSPYLDPSGKLTPEQVRVVDSYIAKFKSTSVGQEAIAHYQRRERV